MNQTLKEIASTCCCKDHDKDHDKNIFGNDNILLILVAVVICLCCGKNFIGNNSCDPCGKTRVCNVGFQGGSWIWIFVILLLFSGKGIGGLGKGGNVNTNVINVDTDDDYDDDYIGI